MQYDSIIDLCKSDIGKDFFITDIDDIDNFILKYGKHGISSHNPPTIERKYYEIEPEFVDGEIILKSIEIDKERAEFLKEYNANGDSSYHTELNYLDFTNVFDLGFFWNSIAIEEAAWTNRFYKEVTNYLNSLANPNTVIIFLKDIIRYTNAISKELDDSLHLKPKGLQEPAELNNIQRDVIIHFQNSYSQFYGFLKNKYQSLYEEAFDNSNTNQTSKENPYPRIFTNVKAYTFFEKLYEAFDINHGSHADISFIYRKMKGDEFICKELGDSEFRNWLNEVKEIHFCKTHTLNKISLDKRNPIYNNLKPSSK